jgi:hypothetical protein
VADGKENRMKVRIPGMNTKKMRMKESVGMIYTGIVFGKSVHYGQFCAPYRSSLSAIYSFYAFNKE